MGVRRLVIPPTEGRESELNEWKVEAEMSSDMKLLKRREAGRIKRKNKRM